MKKEEKAEEAEPSCHVLWMLEKQLSTTFNIPWDDKINCCNQPWGWGEKNCMKMKFSHNEYFLLYFFVLLLFFVTVLFCCWIITPPQPMQTHTHTHWTSHKTETKAIHSPTNQPATHSVPATKQTHTHTHEANNNNHHNRIHNDL